MNVLALLKLQPSQVVTYLTPIARLPQVENLHIVRDQRVDFPSQNIVWHEYGRVGGLRSLPRLHQAANEVLKSHEIDYIVGINPLPYGLAAWRLAKRFNKPISISLIGSDYRYHCHAWYRAPLHSVLRQCDAVTGTGDKMVETIRSWGVPDQRVRVLPHALDMTRFKPTTPLEKRRYDAICVGRLTRRKRVDLAIRAFGEVLKYHPRARLAIVGDGPLRAKLEALAIEVGARRQIDFFGEQRYVEHFFNDARVHLLTSEVEGLPFVMLEAMSCGCVPICTRCGTIDDVIMPGKNGFLVDQLDWQAVADHLIQLLENPHRMSQMSQTALLQRDRYSWEAAERIWQAAFRLAA